MNPALAFSDHSEHEITTVYDIIEADLSTGGGSVTRVMEMKNDNNYGNDNVTDNDATTTGVLQHMAPEFAGVPQNMEP